jgi:hypothetical protein
MGKLHPFSLVSLWPVESAHLASLLLEQSISVASTNVNSTTLHTYMRQDKSRRVPELVQIHQQRWEPNTALVNFIRMVEEARGSYTGCSLPWHTNASDLAFP